ncbi:phosphatase PAP2 family protein [Listeria kieliensis]|uniref:Phosphatidic acid phosphatase type 2/haloperoxidase domain-containing protein n=1 Tax=Listeria kieliensis TaxID=1621700 RepID=A0A3D8TP57_9LIST|nr:phosphatase PAP2 family protein [Listeria kieliensis]RDX00605.1 hypothetical protein UR08_06330 [Listeria kieliensis]
MNSKKQSSHTLLLISGTVFALIFLFFWRSVSVKATWLMQLDQNLNQLIRSDLKEPLVEFFKVFTDLGGTMILTIFSVLLFLFLWKTRGLLFSLWAGITLLLGELVLPQIVKHIELRPRPLDKVISISGYSFPSGHAAGSTTFYGLTALILILFFLKKSSQKWMIGILAFLFIGLIMFSRVYLGVHYPSDVLAGFSLSASLLSFSFYFLFKSPILRRS